MRRGGSGEVGRGERSKPSFRDAYQRRRCIVPVDGFFEWMAVKGCKVKQPYAIAMKDRSPFGIAGVWENWRDPATPGWVRTFAIITVPANALVSRIHDRMPAILAPGEFDRWLGVEPDPRDLMRPFDPDLMIMWPVSTRVKQPEERRSELGGPGGVYGLGSGLTETDRIGDGTGSEQRLHSPKLPEETHAKLPSHLGGH
jgi:putative SOS response-associated peptidase YedK